MEQQVDSEYNSGLAFNYNCIMSALKRECPKLDMDKLEASVNRYIEEQN